MQSDFYRLKPAAHDACYWIACVLLNY